MPPSHPQRLVQRLLAVVVGLSVPSPAQQVFLQAPGGPSGGVAGGSVAADAASILLGREFLGSATAVATFQNLAPGPTLTNFSALGFGSALAVDGNFAAVGAHSWQVGSISFGSVYVYDQWSETQALFAPDAQPDDLFGASVDLDGDLLLVGAPYADAPAIQSGAAYVFGRHSGAWVLEAKLVPPAVAPNTRAGTAVALSGDYAAVSADGGPTYGRVDLWKRTGIYPFVDWEHRTTILNGDPTGGFGASIAFRDPLLAVRSNGSGGAGYVRIFTRSAPGSDSWTLQSTIAPLDSESGDAFGSALSFCNAGLWVGAPEKPYAGTRVGAAYLFGTQGDGVWQQLQKALPFDLPASARFGRSLATFTNGTESVVIGAPGRNGAYVLPSSPPPAVYCVAKTNSQGCLPSIAFSGTPSLSNPAGFTVSATNIINNTSGVIFWGLLQNNVPFAGGTLCVSPPLRRTPVQFAGGNPPPSDCSGSFSYLFTPGYLTSNFQIGSTVFAQYYSRDNGFPNPNNIGLTNAVRFTVLP